jgi:hypothetical protein
MVALRLQLAYCHLIHLMTKLGPRMGSGRDLHNKAGLPGMRESQLTLTQ